jgi:hypothetical protein
MGNGLPTPRYIGSCIARLYVAAIRLNDTLEATHIARCYLAETLCFRATSSRWQPHKNRWLIRAHSKIGLKQQYARLLVQSVPCSGPTFGTF